nr:unnamed protein product [Callosobruchus analis]
MKVQYAVQVFSNSVFAAIMTAVATNDLNSKTAINTAKCFKKINNIFDCLNSEYEKKNVYCLEGFQWTIKAVLILWDNLQKEGVKYFLTSCLSQDPLENLFSVIRHRGGYNPQPTAREFRIALQHNMRTRLQNFDSSNCEVDDNELLDVTDLNTDFNEDCNNIEAKFKSLDSSEEQLEHDDTCPDTEDLLITEIKAAQEYFSSVLGSDNEESPFTVIKSLLSVFDTLFEQVKTEHGMVKKCKTSLLNHLQHSYPTWPHSCRDHKLLTIDQLIKVKVFRLTLTRWIVENDNNLNRSTFTGKPHRKIRMLSSKK